MSHISHDPDRIPEIDIKLINFAISQERRIAFIVCHNLLENDSVQFATLVDFMPRIGEQICLEDKKTCQVKNIRHNVVTFPETIDCPSHSCLVTNIYCQQI